MSVALPITLITVVSPAAATVNSPSRLPGPFVAMCCTAFSASGRLSGADPSQLLIRFNACAGYVLHRLTLSRPTVKFFC